MRGSRIILTTALVACAAAVPAAHAAVEGEIRSKDKVLGTILPGSEVERWRIACPADSRLKVTLKGPKKKAGGEVSFRLLDPSELEIEGLPIKPKGTGAKLSAYDVPASGLYTVEVFAPDGETGGDYKLKIVCKPPRKLSFEATLNGTEQSYAFFTVLGTKVKAKLKPTASSAAGPILVRFDGPDDYSEPINVGPPKGVASPKVVLQRTGEYDLFFDGDGGEVAGSLKITPQKSAKRTIDVRADTIDPDGDGGEQAVVGVIGPEGGSVVAPGDGSNPSDIGGAGVDVPPGALDAPVAIVIATAPPIGPQEDTQDPAGNTVFFGPEGLEFSEDATLTLPFDPLLVQSEDDVRVYTQDADGIITLIPPETYVVNLAAGTVTVPTSHFSSFRVFNERGPLDVENVLTAIPDTLVDVVAYRGVGQSISRTVADEAKAGRSIGIREEYLVAHGAVIDHVVVDPEGGPPQVVRVVGGGQQRQTPVTGLEFAFPGPLTALATDGFVAFASTATQVFVLLPDFDGGFEIDLVAGTGVAGDSGDGGDPELATFTNIADLLVPLSRGADLLLVLDRGATRLRTVRIDNDNERLLMATLLGTGTPGVGPDGVPPETSPLLDPTAMALGPEFGEVFVADAGRIRLVQVVEDSFQVRSLHGGVGIQNHTFAGPVDGTRSNGAEGVSRRRAGFQDVVGMAPDFFGRRLLVVDRGTHTIQEIPTAPGGIVRSLVGTRGVATPMPQDFAAPGTLSSPGRCVLDFGNLLFLEQGTSSLRCVTVSPSSFDL